MEKSGKKSIWKLQLSLGGIKNADLVVFTKHLAVTLKSGLTISEGLEIFVDQSEGKLQRLVQSLLDRVRAGDPLYQALAEHPKYFSPIYVNIVKSGELSGALDMSLQKLTVQLEKSYALKRKVKSAMIYPMIILVAVFGLGMAVAIFILPKILPLFSSLDLDLPMTTRGLIYVAEKFQNYGLEIFVGFLAFVGLFFWLVRRDFMKPFTHRLALKVPVLKKILRNINLERFNHTFGSLLESGLPVDQSLRITADAIDNRVYKKATWEMVAVVEGGTPVAAAMENYADVFPIINTRMIGVGERTGNLSQNAKYLAKFYEEAVDESMKNLTTTLEPVLLLGIGLVVGVIAISILSPIYQITGNLR